MIRLETAYANPLASSIEQDKSSGTDGIFPRIYRNPSPATHRLIVSSVPYFLRSPYVGPALKLDLPRNHQCRSRWLEDAPIPRGRHPENCGVSPAVSRFWKERRKEKQGSMEGISGLKSWPTRSSAHLASRRIYKNICASTAKSNPNQQRTSVTGRNKTVITVASRWVCVIC